MPVMASMLAGRAPATLLRQGRRLPRTLPVRSFTAAALQSQKRTSLQSQNQNQGQVKRLGKISIVRNYSSAGQPAPDPKAYIDSGVIKPKLDVDVKKVLVIGSGGLAIGQAGEFDYSGTPDSISSKASSRY